MTLIHAIIKKQTPNEVRCDFFSIDTARITHPEGMPPLDVALWAGITHTRLHKASQRATGLKISLTRDAFIARDDIQNDNTHPDAAFILTFTQDDKSPGHDKGLVEFEDGRVVDVSHALHHTTSIPYFSTLEQTSFPFIETTLPNHRAVKTLDAVLDNYDYGPGRLLVFAYLKAFVMRHPKCDITMHRSFELLVYCLQFYRDGDVEDYYDHYRSGNIGRMMLGAGYIALHDSPLQSGFLTTPSLDAALSLCPQDVHDGASAILDLIGDASWVFNEGVAASISRLIEQEIPASLSAHEKMRARKTALDMMSIIYALPNLQSNA